MSTAAEGLAAQLASGQSLGVVALSVLPSSTRAALKRCAVAPAFDADLYDRLLRGPDGPALDGLLVRGQITPAPGSGEHYQVEPYLRQAGWESWWTDEGETPGITRIPAALNRYAGELAAYYQETGQPVEQLRQLVLVHPMAVRELFLTLYQEADERFDLARCQDLVDVLASADRAHLLPSELAFIRNEHQLYLQARGQWAAAFHQSARYLSRPALERQLLDLLSGTGGLVAQLHAMGGMGKTMQLRWLVARHCLTRRPPIPCARIDFDAVDPVNAVHHPWLLLLEMAQQLNRQMVGAPFTELLGDHDRYLGVLSRSAEGSREALEESAATATDAEDVIFRFLGVLAEAGPAPVLLVLDTMEEVVLRPAGDPDAFVDLFGRIHESASSSRLVFSGRYDLASRLPGFAERFPDAPVIRVTGFEDTEAGRYLTGIRGVQDPDLVAAIVRHSDGMPFTLALFADLAGDLTPDEVDQSEGPKLLYAIDRVLERIPDDRVRWLLRYGVVPRRLGYDFVRRVMWPQLLRGMTGASPYDTPDPDRDGRPRNRPTRIFLRAEDLPEQEDELRALWDRLASYSGASSWVSQDDPEVLTIHPNVRMPLRAMLRRHQVFGMLHAEALAYYQELARTDPPRWQEWTREALYHAFHVRGPDALEDWRAAVAEARRLGRDDWVQDLATDLFAPDYRDASDAPEPALISPQAWYEAQLELARASAERARAERRSGSHGLWSAVEGALSELERLEAAYPGIAERAPRHILVQASLDLARGNPDRTRGLLASLLDGAVPAGPEELRDSRLLLAEALAAEGNYQAEDAYQAAYRMSVNLGDGAGAATVALRLAERRLDADHPEEALLWTGTALSAQPPESVARHIAEVDAAALLALGQPAAVLDRMPAESWPELDLLAIEALLALRRPAAALALAGRNPDRTARFLLLRARAHSDLLQVEQARKAFGEALSAAASGDEGAAIAAAAAAMHLRVTGNLREAEQYLTRASRYSPAPGAAAWLDAGLAKVELLHRLRRDIDAGLELGKVLAVRGLRRRHWARAMVAGLVLDPESAVPLSLLRDQLVEMPAVEARLAVLGDLGRCGRLRRPPDELTALAVLVVDPWLRQREQDRYLPADRARLDLLAAEACRVLGQDARAADLLAAAVPVLAEAEPLVWWDFLLAAARLGGKPDALRRPPANLDYPREPALRGAYLVELAAYRLGADPREATQDRLTRAERLFAEAGKRPLQWRARLFEVRAVLAGRLGDSPGALRLIGQAAAIWDELGDAVRRDAAAVQIVPEPPGTVGARDQTATVPVRWHEATLALDITDPDAIEIYRYWRDEVDQDLVEAPSWVDTRGFAGPAGGEKLIAELRSDWARWGRDAGRRILADPLGPVLAGATAEEPADLRLKLGQPALTAVPWELAWLDGRPVPSHPAVRFVFRAGESRTRRATTVALQRMLTALGMDPGPIDGTAGPQLRRALDRFCRRHGLPPEEPPDRETWVAMRRELRDRQDRDSRPNVLVLRPSVQRSLKSQRGMYGSQADVEAVYRDAGLTPSVIEDPTPATLGEYAKAATARRTAADVVHICAGMDNSGRTAALDFEGGLLPATYLDEVIASLPRTAPPLVILDVTAPPTRTETIRQLLLRNDFGHQLLGLGSIPVVLAAGLEGEEGRGEQCAEIAAALADHMNAAEICRHLHRRAPSDAAAPLELVLPFLGAALFTRVPPDELLEPGLL